MKLSEVDLSAYDLWLMTTRLEDGNPIATHLLWLCRKDADRFERTDALMKMAFEAGKAAALTASASEPRDAEATAKAIEWLKSMTTEDWLLLDKYMPDDLRERLRVALAASPVPASEPEPVACPHCSGTGQWTMPADRTHLQTKHSCNHCNGTGKNPVPTPDGGE